MVCTPQCLALLLSLKPCHDMVQVQKHMKLHITKELTEKDVVSRIMRKENYLIGMLNKV